MWNLQNYSCLYFSSGAALAGQPHTCKAQRERKSCFILNDEGGGEVLDTLNYHPNPVIAHNLPEINHRQVIIMSGQVAERSFKIAIKELPG